ncbi:uncharacterized protein LDX57_011442 [Aspergillus melleus]|uniref:uncharacterized protein n=1 Tax=Aspergillus melleus TaxID=138277 RepID=UPI001E8EA31C|nr:uncharacterized protein LDX57_011442 [Aspergillus melleus]KAH8433808.1 hypothetical protein LDX57_011442 [Aspergillus melleus]
MPLSRKLKLMGLFSLTVVVAIFAVVRIAAVAQPHKYFDATWLWMWSLIECAAAIIVATLASLRQLYVKQDSMQSSSPSNNSSDVWTRENMRSFIPSRKVAQQKMTIVHSSPVDVQPSNMRGKP